MDAAVVDSHPTSEEEVSLNKINASLLELEFVTTPTPIKFPFLSASRLYKFPDVFLPLSIFFDHTTAPEVSNFNIKGLLLLVVCPLTYSAPLISFTELNVIPPEVLYSLDHTNLALESTFRTA